eukprot:4015648-Alexandrium_andersonii.AAC.1
MRSPAVPTTAAGTIAMTPARVPVAVVGTAGFCMCSEALGARDVEPTCTCTRPSCACAHLQPRTPFSVTLRL